MTQAKKHLAYGIDFGTTNTTIALAEGERRVRVLGIDKGATDASVLRSLMYVSPQRTFLFGAEAVEAYLADVAQGEQRRKKLVYTGKHFKMGKFSFVAGYVGEEWVPLILEIEEGTGGRLLQSLKSALSSELLTTVDIFGQSLPIEELLSIFLNEVKRRGDKLAGKESDSAVIGRPVHFVGKNDEVALKRLRKAAELAGFKEVEFEYEPIGAAWDYGLGQSGREQIIFVFDFGGGTLDFSVVKFPERKVLSTGGLPLGGDLIDSQIFTAKVAKYFGSKAKYGQNQMKFPESIFEQLNSWYQISLLKKESFLGTLEGLRYKCTDLKALDALNSLVVNNLGFALYEEIDRAKKGLSVSEETQIGFYAKSVEISETFLRRDFEAIIAEDVVTISREIEQTLRAAGVGSADVDFVVTTGGSSIIPAIGELLKRKFGKWKLKSRETFTSVAVGLALRAGEIFG